MSDDKIKQLPVRMKDQKVLKVVHNWGGCKHLRAEVDEKLAELTCADCGAKLNPIAFLVSMANQLTVWEHAQQSIAKARAELDERKKCRCTKCGEWTEIRTVHNREVAKLKGSAERRSGES
jgi:predicted NAD/FAD-dependent oxidoreductase